MGCAGRAGEKVKKKREGEEGTVGLEECWPRRKAEKAIQNSSSTATNEKS